MPTYSPSQRRSMAIPFIQKGIALGMPANEVLRDLRAAGLGYRRTDFLRDYRTLAELPAKAARISYTPKSYYVDVRNWTRAIRSYARPFTYTVSQRLTNLRLGVEFEFETSIQSSSPLRIMDVEARMRELVGRMPGEYVSVVGPIRIWSLYVTEEGFEKFGRRR